MIVVLHVVAAFDLDRAARAAIVAVPALALGYCAGRLRNDPRDEEQPQQSTGPELYALDEDAALDADMPLARELRRRIEPVSRPYERLDPNGS